MIVIQILILFCHEISGSSLAQLVEDKSAILKDPDTPFNKVDDDVFCGDYDREKGTQSFFIAPLFSGKVDNFRDCKLNCINEVTCKYMAYWRSKKCETYRSCYKRTKEPGSKIGLYRRQTPCEGTLVAYLEMIAREFPKDVIRSLYLPFEWDIYAGNRNALSRYDNPNFICFCTGLTWMTCGIFMTREAQQTEVVAVSDRLRPAADGSMKPPFRFKSNAMAKNGGDRRFIIFTPPGQSEFVLAELRLPEHAIDAFQNTAGCVHIKQCIATLPGGCPIQRRPLESGEPVYIFKDSIAGYAIPGREIPIACISVKGMRSYIVNENNKQGTGFVDPLGRLRHELGKEPRRRVNIPEDYVVYFAFDDLAMSSGICNWKESPDAAPASASGSGSAQASGLSVEEEMEQLGLDDAPAEGSGKKKKKKKKKSAGSAQAGSSQAGTSSGETEDLQEGSKSAPSSQSPEFGPSEQGAGPSSLPNPELGLLGSPFSAGSPASDSDPRIRVVLSDTDIAKLRRSFAQGRERRAKGRDSRVETSNKNNSFSLHINNLSIISLMFIIFLMFSSTCFFKKDTTNVYLEFSP